MPQDFLKNDFFLRLMTPAIALEWSHITGIDWFDQQSIVGHEVPIDDFARMRNSDDMCVRGIGADVANSSGNVFRVRFTYHRSSPR